MAAAAALTLTSLLSRDATVLLVPATEATRLRREQSFQELPARDALCLFRAMDRLSLSDLRRFVHAAALSSFPLSEVGDASLRELVCQAINLRRLVALRASGAGGTTIQGSAELRRLVRQVEEQTRGRLHYGGRPYRLVADVDLHRVPRRDSYEVVGHDEARRVLDGIARQATSEGDLATLLGQARTKLSPDWRPPISQPDGLVLLRGVSVAQAVPVEQAPALTPSQLQQLAQPKPDSWIKILLLDADSGEGIDRVSLSLRLPEAKEASSHVTGDDGSVDVTNLPSGTFSLEGADDDDDWVWELVDHEQE
jgi:hypothetical protein